MSARTFNADALLIDLDGTLVDSHDAITRAWERWAAGQGIELATVIEVMPGRTARAVIEELRPELAGELVAAQADEVLAWQVADTDGVVPCRGARELIDRLPADRWAVVTACSDSLARARLNAAGLPIPDVLVGSDLARASKPDPSGYLLAARMLGVDPARCLVVEDSPAGYEAGRAAGATVLAVGAAPSNGSAGNRVHATSLERVRVETASNGYRVRVVTA